jgi:hypothetical protein
MRRGRSAGTRVGIDPIRRALPDHVRDPVRAPRRLLRPAIWPGATRATWVKRSPSSPRGPSVSPEPHLSMRALHMSRDAGGGQHRGRFQGYDVQRAIGERRGHGSSCRSCPSRARSVPGGLIAPEGLVVAGAVDAAHPFPLEEGRIGWGLSLSELCDARPPPSPSPCQGEGIARCSLTGGRKGY